MSKEDPDRWFGPRTDYLGWGWRPVTWQGWVVVGVFMAGTVGAALMFRGVVLVVTVAAMAVGLVGVAAVKGGRPGSGWSRN